jgi:hypothetical protein
VKNVAKNSIANLITLNIKKEELLAIMIIIAK